MGRQGDGAGTGRAYTLVVDVDGVLESLEGVAEGVVDGVVDGVDSSPPMFGQSP